MSAPVKEGEKKKTGPPPSGKKFKGVAMPSFFKEESWKAFNKSSFKESDIILCTVPKAGTTWVHKILFYLVHMDDEGKVAPENGRILSGGQMYPEWLPLEKPKEPHFFTKDWTLPELFSQNEPRIFTTHLPATLLPEQIQKGTGRVIYVTRNLNDTMVSLHFFRGEAKDGWEGNEHGPGSFYRFNTLDPVKECPNAYGCCYEHMLKMQKHIDKVGAKKSHVVYYEALKMDLGGEIKKLASFLGLEITQKKIDLIVERVTFKAMKARGGVPGVLLRKGVIGDYKNNLSAKHWEQMSKLFDERLGKCALAQPLKKYTTG